MLPAQNFKRLEARVLKLEKPAKDIWDKLGVLGVITGAIAVPIALATASYFIQLSVSHLSLKQQHSEKLIEVAVAVLSADPKSHAASPVIHDWAILLINHYSEVKLSSEAVTALKENPLIPNVDSDSRVELFSRELSSTGMHRETYRLARIDKYSKSFGEQEVRVKSLAANKKSLVYLRAIFYAALFAEFSQQLAKAKSYYEQCLSHPLANDPAALTGIGLQIGKEAKRHLDPIAQYITTGKSDEEFNPTLP